MEKPNTIYRVAIDYKAREYKNFETEEQAMAFAREMVEADGNHVFMSAKRGCDGKMVLRWMEWTNAEPIVVSKTIGIANTKELEAYSKWQAEQRQKVWFENWKKSCTESLEKIKANRAQEQKRETIVIRWK